MRAGRAVRGARAVALVRLLLLPLLLVAAGCAGERWSRIVSLSPTWRAHETAFAVYRDAAGRQVTLAGEVHLGERAYFEDVHRALAGCDVVLFEGVSDVPDKTATRREASARVVARVRELAREEAPPDPRNGLVLGGFAPLAKHENLVWADVTWATILAWAAEAGGSTREDLAEVGVVLEELHRRPGEERPDVAAGPAEAEADALRRLVSAGFARSSLLSRDAHGSAGELDSIIVEKRNQVALETLDEELAAGRRRPGILFGASHLPGIVLGLEARGFTRSGERRWIRAFAGQVRADGPDFPQEGPRIPRGHSLWIDSGREIAELRFHEVDRDREFPRAAVVFYRPDGTVLREAAAGTGYDRDRPLWIEFELGRELFFGWEEKDDGSLVLRYDPPPQGVAPHRFAGPLPTVATAHKAPPRAGTQTAFPADLRWRADPAPASPAATLSGAATR